MKNIILVLTILFSVNSYAWSKKKPVQPLPEPVIDLSGYKLLSSEVKSTDWANTNTQLQPQCLAMISEAKLNALSAAEINCNEVISKITITRIVDGHRQQDVSQTLNMDVYCKPRSFSDIALVSLYKKCMEVPQQECFNTTLLARLDQVKPTTFKEILVGHCGAKNGEL